jgi:hypothetical protein
MIRHKVQHDDVSAPRRVPRRYVDVVRALANHVRRFARSA